MMRVSGNRSFVRIRDDPNEQVQIVSCPTVLYKFLSPKYVCAFLDGSDILVGRLTDFRTMENDIRGDPHEGEKRHEVPNGIIDGGDLGQALYIGGPVESYDNRVTSTPPPSYCLCFSTVASRELADRFRGENEPPAACVRIHNPQAFLVDVDRAFRSTAPGHGLKVTGSFAAPVCYKRGSMTHWSGACAPYDVRLIKSYEQYHIEAEYRIVWSVVTEGEPVHLTLAQSRRDLAILDADALPDHVTADVYVTE